MENTNLQVTKKSYLKQVDFKKIKNSPWILILPCALFLVIFLGYPLATIFIKSIYNGSFTAENYIHFFSDSLYSKVLLSTLKTGFIVVVVCLLLGYPVAYTMTFVSARKRALIMIAVLLPFWTSLLVRTYAWMILLQSKGIINKLLMSLGIIDQPLKLMYNSIGVVIGMSQVLLPYMILSMYSVMEGIDKNLIFASRSLGANSVTTFFRVFLPLSLPGVASGTIMVFIMAIGYFITPSLLGGQKNTMISQLIQTQISQMLNWGFGSAIAFTLLAVTLVLLLISRTLFNTEKAK